MDNLLDAPRPSVARRFFIEYNPFYLLSACCMLFGLFSLNDSLDWSPLPGSNLLWLVLLLNVYEFMLVGLGFFLYRRGLRRDAATLFILEAFFLVDAGFLNAECFMFDFQIGMMINMALFVLAFVKVGLIFRAMQISLSDGRFVLVLAQVLLLLTIPGIFKHASEQHNGVLPPMAMYGVWWLVGLLPILYVMLHDEARAYWHRGVVGTLVLLPAISILAHLCTSNWVYHVRWHSANLSPLLLGLAIAAGVCDRHVRSVSSRMRLQLLLPVLAIVLAWVYPTSLEFSIGNAMMTPLRITLLGAMVVYLHGLAVHRHPYYGIAGAFCLSAAGLGESPARISENVTVISESGARSLWTLVPRTIAGWGVVSVAASFVLLGLGALLSLTRREQPPVLESVNGNDVMQE